MRARLVALAVSSRSSGSGPGRSAQSGLPHSVPSQSLVWRSRWSQVMLRLCGVSKRVMRSGVLRRSDLLPRRASGVGRIGADVVADGVVELADHAAVEGDADDAGQHAFRDAVGHVDAGGIAPFGDDVAVVDDDAGRVAAVLDRADGVAEGLAAEGLVVVHDQVAGVGAFMRDREVDGGLQRGGVGAIVARGCGGARGCRVRAGSGRGPVGSAAGRRRSGGCGTWSFLSGVSGLGCASDGAGLGQDAVDEGLGGAEIVGRVGEAVDGGGVEVGGDGRVLEEGFG